jgi:cyclic beta-1,2-glucan synthetase
VRFLANRDRNLHFALLSDFPDARDATTPRQDDALAGDGARAGGRAQRSAMARIAFCCATRERRVEREPGAVDWMGAEALASWPEFNRLLRGARDTSFVVLHGDVSVLESIKYVITLDSDTHLPIDAARRLVGALSHPLNRPRFNAQLRRVTEGYAILQPRVQVSVESAARTPFAQVYSGHVGLDPYTTAVSDVYQDLFHEGTYVGKGIYDVDAFEAALKGVFRKTPCSVTTSSRACTRARDSARTSTWWTTIQPTTWRLRAASIAGSAATGRSPDGSGGPYPTPRARAVANHLPAVCQMEDPGQPARSLLAPAIIALWSPDGRCSRARPMVWSGLALMVLAFPAYMQVGRSLSNRARGIPLREHRARRTRQRGRQRQPGVPRHGLPAAPGRTDARAVTRTLVRAFTRHRMLEWVTADRATATVPSRRELLRRMLATPWPPARSRCWSVSSLRRVWALRFRSSFYGEHRPARVRDRPAAADQW